jgi:hypothetical protein
MAQAGCSAVGDDGGKRVRYVNVRAYSPLLSVTWMGSAQVRSGSDVKRGH